MCIRNQRFTRETQEDSHEVLRCMFDALKTEEIQVCILIDVIRKSCKLVAYMHLIMYHALCI